jgi:hypothetical protein
MKTVLFKTVMVTLLSLLAVTTASAGWMCKVHNARNQVWTGTAATRSGASANAIRFCSGGSSHARNCVIDYCQSQDVASAAPASGGYWECDATNARNQLWVGTGATRAIAASNATRFCAGHSSYARNCQIQGCTQR